MPAILLLGVGAAGGWFVAKGTEQTASLAKWVVIGGGLYLVGKYKGLI